MAEMETRKGATNEQKHINMYISLSGARRILNEVPTGKNELKTKAQLEIACSIVLTLRYTFYP